MVPFRTARKAIATRTKSTLYLDSEAHSYLHDTVKSDFSALNARIPVPGCQAMI